MAFLDDLSRTLSDKGKEAALKAREAAELLQMKAQIGSEKSKLKELYGAVGVLYYKKHRDDEDNEFGDLFREIGNVLTNVAALEEKVQGLEGSLVCPNCRKVMKRDALYCSHCGTALKSEPEEAAEEFVQEAAAEEEDALPAEEVLTVEEDLFETEES
ncbi:MAG: zinc ribbon domain-containing protein [Hungatella sp.]|nr:zinc ribbon domain-containing protein [Hungatella sp.]